MKKLLGILAVSFLALPLAGCSSMRQQSMPAYTEVLEFGCPFDLTYLKTFEALDSVTGWEIDETDKERGRIRVRNTEFSNLADKDKSTALFLIQRVGRSQTSVQLAPESQHVLEGAKLMKRIAEFLGPEA